MSEPVFVHLVCFTIHMMSCCDELRNGEVFCQCHLDKSGGRWGSMKFCCFYTNDVSSNDESINNIILT